MFVSRSSWRGLLATPFQTRAAPDHRAATPPRAREAGPVVVTPPVISGPTPEAEPAIEVPTPAAAAARPAARAAGHPEPGEQGAREQAQGQRKRGDLPGAAVSLDRALRIEPSNPLLWIEIGRLRMDQGNFPQAEAWAARRCRCRSVTTRTQSQAWQLIGESLRARGRNRRRRTHWNAL